MLTTFRAILFEHDLGTTLSAIKTIFTWMNYYNYSSTYEIPSVFHVLFPKTYLNKLGQISIDWSSWLFKFFGFDELNWIFFFSSFFLLLLFEGVSFSVKVFVQSGNSHCLKSVQIRRFFWSLFSRIRTKYVEIRSISPHSVRMRESKDQKQLRIWTLFL